MESIEIERRLNEAGALTVAQANSIVIQNDAQYAGAAELLKQVKSRANEVKAYWKEPKENASKAHKALCEKEKQMLEPLTQAEGIIKKSMLVYQQEVDRKRRQAEEEARRRAQEEAERLLSEAIKAEQEGKAAEAETAMNLAQTIDAAPVHTNIVQPKASGIHTTKRWKARVTDPQKVPAYANGIEIRTISMSALDSIARMTKGTCEIPGVEFFEEESLSARV